VKQTGPGAFAQTQIIISQYHHGHRLQQTGPVLRKKIKREEKNNNYVILFSESLNAG